MTHLEILEKVEFVKELINKRNTGTPAELAQRLNISERSLSRLIKTLKENNYPISYCRTKQSYIID
ncbi:helix-turn-helix domain-containing protein [Labilibaculum sp. K2S]|uniref:helix-turn-helix domain-containing protein n=1 Tax=Labilibaculum sp. K2S TaxID=3056386 RepID=UPI0025A4C020|nr:helix-turn-helix domain-containing protein [Labilibaculum sp. K2S]MDM8161412.1 helix-turn-helix domain-containing protein [Labilibaculum sp. K2S]